MAWGYASTKHSNLVCPPVGTPITFVATNIDGATEDKVYVSVCGSSYNYPSDKALQTT